VKVIDTAAAKGDPHLQNILGQKFDLMMPGLHTLLKIPRTELDASAKLKLLISADAERVQEDASCGELYFQTINLSGEWVGRHPLSFHANDTQRDGDAKWMKLGGVEAKITHGVTLTGISYLNLMVKNLQTLGFAVGGLLGEDSHDLQAAPRSHCRKVVSLDLRSTWQAIAE